MAVPVTVAVNAEFILLVPAFGLADKETFTVGSEDTVYATLVVWLVTLGAENVTVPL